MNRWHSKALVWSAGSHAVLFTLLLAIPLLWVHPPDRQSFMTFVRSDDPAPPAVTPPPPSRQIDSAQAIPTATVTHSASSPSAKAVASAVEKTPTPAGLKPSRSGPANGQSSTQTKTAEPSKPPTPTVTTKRHPITVSLEQLPPEGNPSPRGPASVEGTGPGHNSQVQSAIGRLESLLSPGSSISIPGVVGSTGVDDGYARMVIAAYKSAWRVSDGVSDSISAEATVIIGRDGTVKSFHLTRSSSDGALDRSVARLESIRKLPANPEATSDEPRVFVIQFKAH